MTRRSRQEYVQTIRPRYAHASRDDKHRILTEFCATTGYHRKYAIQLLSPHAAPRPPRQRHRPPTYRRSTVTILAAIWEAAGYPWSVRLKALLPLWLPWATRRFPISPQVARQLRTISPSTIDRHLQTRKRRLRRRLYGRTKPGTLLKHHIPIKTEHWDVTTPGFTEADLVSHSGNSADGLFLQSLNLTDILTGWVETRAIPGKGQAALRVALEDMRRAFPFPLRGLDSDNGSEFINRDLLRYCQRHAIQFTRGRPYKKDDNAHVEQKNWTHVRKLLGWDRYDSPRALQAINNLYRHELRLMMNLFQPSVKLQRKVRIGARLKRVYDRPQTPLDRLCATGALDAGSKAAWLQLRERLDPFTLAQTIDRKLTDIHRLANRQHSPRPTLQSAPPKAPVLAPARRGWQQHASLFRRPTTPRSLAAATLGPR